MLELVLGLLLGAGIVIVLAMIVGRAARKRLEPPEVFKDYLEAQEPIDKLADIMGWPRQWIICPSCSEQAWRIPPHLFGTPCPYIEQTMEAMGLKLDAERMSAVRNSLMMEKQAETMQKMLREFLHGEEDE